MSLRIICGAFAVLFTCGINYVDNKTGRVMTVVLAIVLALVAAGHAR